MKQYFKSPETFVTKGVIKGLVVLKKC